MPDTLMKRICVYYLGTGPVGSLIPCICHPMNHTHSDRPPDLSNNAYISVVNPQDQYQSIAITQFHIAIATHVCLRTCFKEVSGVQLDTWVSGCLGKDESTDHFHTSNESFTLFIKALRHPAATHRPLIVSDPDASQKHSEHYPMKQQPSLPHTSLGTYCLCEPDRSDITKTPLSVCGLYT